MTQTKKRLQQGQPNQWRICGDSHLTPALNHLRGQSEQRNFNMLEPTVKHKYLLSSDAQERRVLAYLKQHQHKGLNRYEADDWLNVCHLAARIKALKNSGQDIKTIMETALDLNGRPHKGIARYFWQGYSAPQNSVNTEAVVL